MLCGVRLSRAWYGYRAHIIYNVLIRSCHRLGEGQGLRCVGLSACAYGHTLAGVKADRGVGGALLLVLSSSASNARDRRTRVDVKRLKRVVVALLLKS